MRRVTSGYCSIHLPARKIVAGTCIWSSSSRTATFANDGTFPLWSSWIMASVRFESKVRATAGRSRGPFAITGAISRGGSVGGTVVGGTVVVVAWVAGGRVTAGPATWEITRAEREPLVWTTAQTPP